MPRLLRDGRREHPHAAGGQIATLFEPQPPQAWQLDGSRLHHDGASEAKAVQSLLLRLGLGIAHPATQLAFPLELDAAEEVGEGVVQIPEGFLWRARGHLLQPGQLRCLEGALSSQWRSIAEGLFPVALYAACLRASP